MEPLTWVTVASLLAKYGPEVVDFIITAKENNAEVTKAEWDKLKAIATKTPKSQLLDAIARAGISVDNEHAKNLLAMTPE